MKTVFIECFLITVLFYFITSQNAGPSRLTDRSARDRKVSGIMGSNITEETDAIHSLRITADVPANGTEEKKESGLKETVYITAVILSTVIIVATLLVICRHIKGQSCGRYHVRSSRMSTEDDHYEKLAELTYSPFGGDLGCYDRPSAETEEHGEGGRYTTLSHESARGPLALHRVGVDSLSLSELEYITPVAGQDWRDPATPRPCLRRLDHTTHKRRQENLQEERTPLDLISPRDSRDSSTLPSHHAIHNEPRQKSTPGLRRSESFSYVYVSEYGPEIVESFIDNPLYSTELDEGQSRQPRDALNVSEDCEANYTQKIVNELAAIKEDIDKSVDTLCDFERTLSKKSKFASSLKGRGESFEKTSGVTAHVQRLDESSGDSSGEYVDGADSRDVKRSEGARHFLSQDVNVNLSVYEHFFTNLAQDETYENTNNSGDSPGSSAEATNATALGIPDVPHPPCRRDMGNYFHWKINDDEIVAMFELMDYVKSPDT